jgi:phosphoribosylamine--glycine ligase
MKILVLGSGGREHAIVWKLQQSPKVDKIWCAPGNGGIAESAECIPLEITDVRAAASLAEQLRADLTIVGPEMPLVLGIADEFAKRGLVLLGPSRRAAELEGSKVAAKKFMQRHGIPTAGVLGIYETLAEAQRGLGSVTWPLVIKADGLCAGKGVLVTSSREEAGNFIERLMRQDEFGEAGGRVLFEEGLVGVELSYIILTDGNGFISMAPSRDHKRAYEDDLGPNTGGMGAYSSDDILPKEVELEILDRIVRPTLEGLRQEEIAYRGFLYFGLMLTASGPKVLEYNCRLGDPETEAILLRADFDLPQACNDAAHGELGDFHAGWTPGASVSIVVASEGYPAKPVLGKQICGLGDARKVPGAVVLHAGTRQEGGKFYTTGGRVVVVSAAGMNLPAACQTAYEAIEKIKIDGAFFRKDIGVIPAHRR